MYFLRDLLFSIFPFLRIRRIKKTELPCVRCGHHPKTGVPMIGVRN